MIATQEPEQSCSFLTTQDQVLNNSSLCTSNQSASPSSSMSNEENESKNVEKNNYSISSLLNSSNHENNWQNAPDDKKLRINSPDGSEVSESIEQKESVKTDENTESGNNTSTLNALAFFMQQMNQQEQPPNLTESISSIQNEQNMMNLADAQQAQNLQVRLFKVKELLIHLLFQQMYLQCFLSQFSPQLAAATLSNPLRMMTEG